MEELPQTLKGQRWCHIVVRITALGQMIWVQTQVYNLLCDLGHSVCSASSSVSWVVMSIKWMNVSEAGLTFPLDIVGTWLGVIILNFRGPGKCFNFL